MQKKKIEGMRYLLVYVIDKKTRYDSGYELENLLKKVTIYWVPTVHVGLHYQQLASSGQAYKTNCIPSLWELVTSPVLLGVFLPLSFLFQLVFEAMGINTGWT